MNPQFWFFAHLSDHRRSFFCNAINNFTMFFFSFIVYYFKNDRSDEYFAQCSFFFALHLEWFLNLSTDKSPVAICIFVNLCSTLFSLWFEFSSGWFYFLSKCAKKRVKTNGVTLFDITLFKLFTGDGSYINS